MIRNLTGLFTKLLDSTEKIIVDESTILDDYVGQLETITLSDGGATVRDEYAPPFYWAAVAGGHSEMRWNHSQWS